MRHGKGRGRSGAGRRRGMGQGRRGRGRGQAGWRRGFGSGGFASDGGRSPGAGGSVAPRLAGAVRRHESGLGQLDLPRRRPASRHVSQPDSVAVVVDAACTLCGACERVCPADAIELGDRAVRVNGEACVGCAACVEVCPNGAITLVKRERQEGTP
jgi:ferredoxin